MRTWSHRRSRHHLHSCCHRHKRRRSWPEEGSWTCPCKTCFLVCGGSREATRGAAGVTKRARRGSQRLGKPGQPLSRAAFPPSNAILSQSALLRRHATFARNRNRRGGHQSSCTGKPARPALCLPCRHPPAAQSSQSAGHPSRLGPAVALSEACRSQLFFPRPLWPASATPQRAHPAQGAACNPRRSVPCSRRAWRQGL